MYIEAIKNSSTLKTVPEFQLDIGPSPNNTSPKCLIAAHQTEAGAQPADAAKLIAIFDKVVVEEYFLEIDDLRYAKDFIDVDYAQINNLNQYRGLQFFFQRLHW